MRMSGTVRLLAVVLLVIVAGASVRPTAAQEYTIGPGDVLKVTVWGHDDLSKEYPVTLDGRVPFPLIGSVPAVGLTTTEFAKRLRDLLEKDYLVNPQVIVAVKEYLSRKVHVIGDAEKPGLFYLTGPTTLLEVLSKAGGLSKSAGKDVLVVRATPGAGSSILRFDLRKIQAGDTKENIFLENGDMMFVPKASAIFVLGEVGKAGTFPLDKETSVLEAITLAGGFANTAAPAGVKVLRRTAEGRQETISLDLAGAVPRDKNFRLEDGDTVLVPGLFLVTVLTVAIWTFLQTPMYQATATVLIEPEPPKVLNIQDVSPMGGPTQDYYRTQYEIITSRPIVEKTIEALNLKQRLPELARAADPIRAFQAS